MLGSSRSNSSTFFGGGFSEWIAEKQKGKLINEVYCYIMSRSCLKAGEAVGKVGGKAVIRNTVRTARVPVGENGWLWCSSELNNKADQKETWGLGGGWTQPGRGS